MKTPRDNPYVWVTWISSLLSGEAHCEWAAWFRAHYWKYTKRPRSGDLPKWQIEHTTLLATVRDQYRDKGYIVRLENQNEFKLKGKVGTLAGKPDLIAIKDKEAWVVDVKTKPFRVCNTAQVRLYMMSLPRARDEYRGVTFEGRLINPFGDMHVASEDITTAFRARVRSLMERVCGDEPPLTSPSPGECHHCDLTDEDCSDRMDDDTAPVGVTDDF